MKIKAATFFLFILNIILSSCSKDDDIKVTSMLEDDIENKEYAKIIKDNISNLPENGQIAMAILDGTSTEFIGIHNRDNVLRKIDNADKIFEIGSVTKVFTSICLSNLIAENKVNLTDKLQDQFNFPLKDGNDITLQQLANHTSGLPRLPNNIDELTDFKIEDPYANYTINNLESYLQNHLSLNYESGTDFEYSNTGVGLLGYILSQKMESNYEDMLQNLIFKPLEMVNSTTLLENVDTTKLVYGTDENNNQVSHWNFTDAFSGTGSIKSSVKDMEKFIRKNFENDPIYNLPQETTFNFNQVESIGMGWFIIEADGIKVVNHNGSTGGYSSYLIMDKDNKKAVILLCNVASSKNDFRYVNMLTELGKDLIEHLSS